MEKELKILAFGVHHWDNREPTQDERDYCQEWHERIKQHINPYKTFVTTGTYSNPVHSPFTEDIQIVQNKVPVSDSYSRAMNYFRNGFMTGIWNALINEDDWDVLFHIQSRVLIGKSIKDELCDFMQRREMKVMAPRFTSQLGVSIEISIFAMKPFAVRKYATSAVRQSLNIYNAPDLNCEEEAFVMFNNTWFNPWQDVLTTRQLDSFDIYNEETSDENKAPSSPFNITNPEALCSLPFISTGKHVDDYALEAWKEAHPCTF